MEELKKIIENNIIENENGKKELNEFGTILLTFACISIVYGIINLYKERKNKKC